MARSTRESRSRPVLAYTSLVIFLVVLIWHPTGPYERRPPSSAAPSASLTDAEQLRQELLTVTCDHSWGNILSDFPKAAIPQEHVPQPYAGCYADLNLHQSWLTAKERFRPYGGGHDSSPASGPFPKVDWAHVQNVCSRRNERRFSRDHFGATINPYIRLQNPTWRDSSWAHWLFESKMPAQNRSGITRTAIVLRAWSTFDWKDEDIWHLRALITEAGLTSAGEYVVHILMHVQDDGDKLASYDELLDTLVPGEFRNMTTLFDEQLLKRWYWKTHEHRPERQMFQPLQLFAQAYPQYDFYWQMEMDARFTGHAGMLLTALATFARKEPRKQARQRASFAFLPSMHGNYTSFIQAVDGAVNGEDAYYTGIRIADIVDPIGPLPPTDAREDNFEWGVGEEADLITLSPINNASIHKSWMYYDYVRNFKAGVSTPRLVAPVTAQRASRDLLNAIHDAQISTGLAVQSESILVSFALWHGLKISMPPLPLYSRHDYEHTLDELNRFINGGPPDAAHDGMAHGEWVYEHDGEQYRQSNTTLHDDIEPTYRFISPYPGELWRAWMHGYPADWTEEQRIVKLPTLLVKNGQTYLPNTIFHPVKPSRDG